MEEAEVRKKWIRQIIHHVSADLQVLDYSKPAVTKVNHPSDHSDHILG